MISESRAANAVGGKTARACDSCLRKRARWYCTSDDAFLCQSCDSSVHSANQLASRHERVRLGTASFKVSSKTGFVPAWHHGFTRKKRTQRQRKDKEAMVLPVVPEIGSEEASNDDCEDHHHDQQQQQLLFQVPVFDPFDAELCEAFHQTGGVRGDNCLDSLLSSDMELAEFAADVESLLGTGLDDDSCGMEELGLKKCKEEDDDCFGGNNNGLKIEDEDEEIGAMIACSLDPASEMLDWNFDYESPVTEEEEEKIETLAETAKTINVEIKEEAERKISLKINYEEVISAWDNQRCPWLNGSRPEFNPNDCWPDFLQGNFYGGGVNVNYGSIGGRVDGGREARVSRYREKRRTRLFSKKIRYEVRKLNAEKRPRMKGRFVKRSSFPN